MEYGKCLRISLFDSAPSGCAGHGYQRDDIFFKQIERCVDCALEFGGGIPRDRRVSRCPRRLPRGLARTYTRKSIGTG